MLAAEPRSPGHQSCGLIGGARITGAWARAGWQPVTVLGKLAALAGAAREAV